MALHGKGGKVKNGANTVLDITSWSLDVDRDKKEITSFADSNLPWRDYVGGLVGASGKLEGNLNMGDTTGQLALWQSLTSDTPLSMSFYTDATHNFAGSILITKFSPKAPIDDLETVGYDFTVTAAVTYT
jgi:predicted secreted protein